MPLPIQERSERKLPQIDVVRQFYRRLARPVFQIVPRHLERFRMDAHNCVCAPFTFPSPSFVV